MNMDKFIDKLSAGVPVFDDEYVGDDDLLHCERCGGARQTRITVFGTEKVVRCICACKKAELDANEASYKRDSYEIERKKCFLKAVDNMRHWKFENDDRRNPKWSTAMRRYVDNFDDFKSKSKGLLLYGTVGTGKSFFAACIANALIDKGYTVKMRTFEGLEKEYFNAKDKLEFMNGLNQCDLLIFDDLGAERKSDFMNSLVFDIIDSRSKAGLPFICTTNLTGEELNSPDNLRHERIYDRVLECCHPVKMEGPSRRKQRLLETSAETKAALGL